MSFTSSRPLARPVLQHRPIGHLGVDHQEIACRLDLMFDGGEKDIVGGPHGLTVSLLSFGDDGVQDTTERKKGEET